MRTVERHVRDLAQRIADAGASERTRIYRMGFWTDRLIDWAMDHPEFRTQLFRFVDVFPACTDDEDVVRHLEEYFSGVDLPTALDLGLEAAEHAPFGAKLGAAVVRRNVRRMARQFIAGETPSDALVQIRELWRAGEATTVDLLGEKTMTLAEADRYAARVHDLLRTLSADAASWPEDAHLERDPWGPVARVNVSVKPTALAPQFAPLTREIGLDQAYERLHPLCSVARELGAAVYLDMEHFDVKDITLDLLDRLSDAFDDLQLGCVIQAYLKDAQDDLHRVIDRSSSRRVPLSIRLVKGAYWDYETITSAAHGWTIPVYQGKGASDANYERCVDIMVRAAGRIRPAFATHNLRSIAYALTAVRGRRLHENAVEVQLLYGMAEPVHAALRRLGYRVRAYAPVGDLVPGMAYLVRRLLENTANTSFLRHRFAEGRDLDDLLQVPSAVEAPELEPVPGEEVAEFRRAKVRERFGAAVRSAGESRAFEAPVVIAGETVRTRDEIVSIDPSDPQRVVCRSGSATPSEADRAIAAALEAQSAWATRTWDERANVLRRAASIMRARRDELAALEVIEAGKPWVQADADVCEAIDFCDYYADQATKLGVGAAVAQAPGESNIYRYRPRGVVAVVSPWNFPLAIPCGMVVAPLVCGNTVLFKPAEQTPGIAYRLTEILLEAGAEPGAIAFLPGVGTDVGAYLVDHPKVSVINFTGSKAVGLNIVERASVVRPGQEHVKRVVAEMGGKNALIVDQDADLDVAVPAVIDSAFGYAGQKCSAASRVIGIGATFEALVERIVEAARLIPVGSPQEMETQVGPVIDRDALERILSYRELAHTEGTVVLERDDVPSSGYFVGPTVVVTDRVDARIATDEIFGPFLVCLRAHDLDHAIEITNATPYALTGGIISRSPDRIRRVIDRMRAGNLYINRSITGAIVGRQPFGGFGLSGVGSKAGGPDHLLQFCDPQVVTENTMRQGFAPEATS